MAIKFGDYFLLRTPISPMSFLFELNFKKSENREQFFNEITDYFFRPEIYEGLYLSSSTLFENLDNWKELRKTKYEISKLDISYFKYFLRSVYRCTPFGTLAGISTGTISDSPSTFKLTNNLRRRIRLDIGYLYDLTGVLLKDKEFLLKLTLHTNNTIHRIDDEYRYTSYAFQNESKFFSLNSIEYTEVLEQVIQKGKAGIRFSDLIAFLANSQGDFEEVYAFIEKLLEMQILFTDLEPSVHGEHFQERVLDTIKAVDQNSMDCKKLSASLKLTYDIPEHFEIGTYNKISKELSEFNLKRDMSRAFLVDTHRQPMNLNICENDLKPVQNLIELRDVFQKSEPRMFESFKERFIELYEDREIPLLVALDAENGIPYPSNMELNDTPYFLRDLPFDEPSTRASLNEQISIFDKLLTEKLSKNESATRIRFSLKELESYSKKKVKNLEETTCMGLILSFYKNLNPKNTGDKFEIYYKGSYGPSSANLLGRFCNIDNELLEKVRATNLTEEKLDKNRIYAEIAHLPGKRVGNIVSRPGLREYEIPILTVPSKNQNIIPLDDLLICIDSSKRVVLRSKNLQKEIIPRLGTAHNFVTNDLPVYRFLCDLQKQDKISGIYFLWPECMDAIRFLPRVNIDNIIILKARWKLLKTEIDQMISTVNDEDLISQFAKLVDRAKIGRFVTFSDGDNQIVIDSENILCLRVLCDLIKGKNEIILEEVIEDVDNLMVKDGNNLPYTNEVIIPITIDLGQFEVSSLTKKFNYEVQKTFPIGSEWLYAKIYCGAKSSDQILLSKIIPLIEDLTRKNLICSWFFIRYRDKDGYHLRLRLKGTGTFYLDCIRYLYESFNSEIESEVVRLKFGIYNREIERYGGELIIESESFFKIDSHLVMQLIQFSSKIGNDLRWLMGAYSINSLLQEFGFDIQDKIDFFKGLSNQFSEEFNVNQKDDLKKAIDKRYREDNVLLKKMSSSSLFHELHEIVKARNHTLSPIIKIIKSKLGVSKISESYLLSSYIHMFLNRLFESRQRQHELLIYHYLFKYNTSIKFAVKDKTKEPFN
jgi:thiopeptide-type bacteriocin biosynthesis protein